MRLKLVLLLLGSLLIACAACSSSSKDGIVGTVDTNTSTDTVGDQSVPDSTPVGADDATVPSVKKFAENVDYAEISGIKSDIFGVTEPIAFDVPSGTLSFTIVILGEDGFLYNLNSLIGPNDQKLVFEQPLVDGKVDPLNNIGICTNCPVRVVANPHVASFLIPNSPKVTVRPGRHSLRVLSIRSAGQGGFPASSTFKIVIYFYKANQRPSKGHVDLTFHFTGAAKLTAANAMKDATFSKALTDFKAIYQTIGVTIGEIRLRDVGADISDITTIMGKNNQLSRLFAKSDGNKPGINIFMVKSITQSGGMFGGVGVILGVSGGIPGPSMVDGSGRSGVAIAVDSSFGSDDYGTVMAHEVGHYLGLFHSTEVVVQPGVFKWLHDPLDDTPQQSAKNLMYFMADNPRDGSTTSDKTLTSDQGFVILNNPILHLNSAGQ